MGCENSAYYLRNIEKTRNNIRDDTILYVLKYLNPLEPLPADVKPAGGLRGPVKALLLDIYGTLLISGSGDIGTVGAKTGVDKHLEKLLFSFDIKIEVGQIMPKLKNAIGKEHQQARSSGIEHPEVVIENIWKNLLGFKDIQTARKFALCFELLTNPVWPMPCLKVLIEDCKSSKIRLGIISNAQFYTPLLFEWFLGKNLQELGFDSNLIFFSYQHGTAKPDVGMFRQAGKLLNHMGIESNQVLYVGNDMLNDILPAHTCGYQTALFAGDRRSIRMREDDERLQDIRPDWIVTELDQLRLGLCELT